jgi:hypothetical protein
MSKETMVLMERYKSWDIYYDKEKERFFAEKKKFQKTLLGKSLWEIKRDIDEDQIVEVDKDYIIETGYFGEDLGKIHMFTLNKATSICKYKVVETTNNSYETDRENKDVPDRLYPLSPENLKIYDEVKALEKEKIKVEQQKKALVARLKR